MLKCRNEQCPRRPELSFSTTVGEAGDLMQFRQAGNLGFDPIFFELLLSVVAFRFGCPANQDGTCSVVAAQVTSATVTSDLRGISRSFCGGGAVCNPAGLIWNAGRVLAASTNIHGILLIGAAAFASARSLATRPWFSGDLEMRAALPGSAYWSTAWHRGR